MIEKVCFFPYAFFDGEIKFLLGTRLDGNFTAPTGHVEKGENYIEAAKREIEEELELKHFRNIINTGESFTFESRYGKFKEYIFAIEIEPIMPNFEQEEFVDMGFYCLEEALGKLTFDSHKKFINLINDIAINRKYPKIFTVSGASASGKGTVLRAIQDPNFSRAKTATTRKPRPNEDFRGRNFFSEDEFDNLDKSGQIIEKFKVHRTDWYGSLYKEIEDPLFDGKNVLIEIDINGVREYKKLFSNVVSIFITISAEDMKRRIIQRNPNESEEEINRRLKTAKTEQEFAKEADYVIENKQGELEKALEEFKKILKKEKYE